MIPVAVVPEPEPPEPPVRAPSGPDLEKLLLSAATTLVVRLTPLLLELALRLRQASAVVVQGVQLGLVLLAAAGTLVLLGSEVRAAASPSPEERLAYQAVAGFLRAASAGRPQARAYLSPEWRRELQDQRLELCPGTTFRVGHCRPDGSGGYLVDVHFLTAGRRHRVIYRVVRLGDVLFLDSAVERRRARTS